MTRDTVSSDTASFFSKLMNAVIHKPFTLDQVRVRVGNLIADQQRWAVDVPRVTYYSSSHPTGNISRNISLIWEIRVNVAGLGV